MSQFPQLVGEVDNRNELIESLHEQVSSLERELREARAETAREKRNAGMAMAALRRQLAPWYSALKALFGEMDAAGIPANEVSTSSAGAVPDAKWESWKRKLGGKAAEFITELLLHGEMTVQQFQMSTRCGRQTVYDTLSKLNKAQLLNKNGGKYSLKQL